MAFTKFNWENLTTKLTYAVMNLYVRDNLEAVRQPQMTVVNTTSGSDFTTSSTSFVDISSTYYQASITPSMSSPLTCRLEVNLRGLFTQTNASNYTTIFDILIDGVSVSGGTGVQAIRGNSASYYPLNLCHIIEGVAAGAHTIKVQWKVENASAVAKLYAANGGTTQMKGQFSVREC